MHQTINKIEFFIGDIKIGEFISDVVFGSLTAAINKQRVRRLRKATAENMYEPENNITCKVYDQNNNLMYQL